MRKPIKKRNRKPISLDQLSVVDVDVKFLKTGIGEIDYEIGGIPQGCILHVAGENGVGKTTCILQFTINALRYLPEDQKIGYCDTENRSWGRMIKYFCKEAGIAENRFLFFQPDYGEEALDQVVEWVEDPEVAIIIIDSLKGIVPKDVILKNLEEHEQQQGQCKLLDRALRSIIARIRRNNKSLILIDHLKEKQLNSFLKMKETATGNTVKFMSSSRWFIKASKWIKKTIKGKERKIGRMLNIIVPKSTVGPMMDISDLRFIFRRGISPYRYFLKRAIELGIITHDGKAYYIKEKIIAKNNKDFVRWVRSPNGKKAWDKIVSKIDDIDTKNFYDFIHTDPLVFDSEFKND